MPYEGIAATWAPEFAEGLSWVNTPEPITLRPR